MLTRRRQYNVELLLYCYVQLEGKKVQVEEIDDDRVVVS
jgi:hypothetical protein